MIPNAFGDVYVQFVLAITFVVIGCVVFVMARGKKSSLYFLLVTISSALWAVSNYFANLDTSLVYIINLFVFLAGWLSVQFIVLFIFNFPEDNKSKISDIILFIPTVVIVYLLFFTKLIIAGTKEISIGTDIVSGSLFHIYTIFIGGYFILFSGMAIYKFRSTSGEMRKQVLYLSLAFTATILIALFTNLVAPSLFNIKNLSDYGPYAIIVVLGASSIIILRFRFLNTRVIFTEVAVYVLWFILAIDIGSSQTWGRLIMRILVLVAVVVIGRLLIRSVKMEIAQKKVLEKLTRELKKSNKKLKQVDAMKTEFVSMASHELLTPISAIEGYLSMIVDEHLVKIEDPKAQKFLANIYSSSKRLARLVGDLLNVSRIEQGRLLMQKTIVDVDALVNSVITELKFRAQERQMTMTPDFRIQGAQASSFADADKIKEILVNLTGNSIKYTQKGGQIVVTVDLWPTAQVEQRYQAMAVQMKTNGHTGALQRIANEKLTQMVGDHQIVISVADNGIGISPQDIGHLFQKFSRVGDWSTQEVQGTGLGLYISRALVEMHHGKIWAESPGEKKGTIFYFSLPLAQYQQQILQLDNQVPQSRDAKPLARMGGGPAAKV